ncbi:MAG: hypothetical protein KBF35_11490, partial [Saprospiraceae bacterium]|nr:hypothetical protein [Saprospiraceae bacterium]
GIGVNFTVFDTSNDSTYHCEAAMGLEGALMYNYPAAIEETGLRIKLDEKVLDDFFTPEDQLEYKEYTIKNGGNIEIQGYKINLHGFNKAPEHPNYKKEEKDIAIGALLNISGNNITDEVAPIYIIRNNQPMSIKHYSGKTGLHIRFSNIDPVKEEFTFKIAKDSRQIKDLKIAIATDVPRTDYLILQATIFPGINLFWAGTILMMLGLFIAAWARYVK